MFDPRQWQVQEFQDAEVVPQAERRLITMTIPLQTVVALSTIFFANGDTSDQEIEMTWEPGTTTKQALLIEDREVFAGEAAMIYPEMPVNPNRPKDVQPFMLIGPGIFRVNQITTVGNAAGAVMIFNFHWFEAKFATKTASPIVPTGATVP